MVIRVVVLFVIEFWVRVFVVLVVCLFYVLGAHVAWVMGGVTGEEIG